MYMRGVLFLCPNTIRRYFDYNAIFTTPRTYKKELFLE